MNRDVECTSHTPTSVQDDGRGVAYTPTYRIRLRQLRRDEQCGHIHDRDPSRQPTNRDW